MEKGCRETRILMRRVKFHRTKSLLLNSCHDSLDNNLHHAAPKKHLKSCTIPPPFGFCRLDKCKCKQAAALSHHMLDATETPLYWIRLSVPGAGLRKHCNASHQRVRNAQSDDHFGAWFHPANGLGKVTARLKEKGRVRAVAEC